MEGEVEVIPPKTKTRFLIVVMHVSDCEMNADDDDGGIVERRRNCGRSFSSVDEDEEKSRIHSFPSIKKRISVLESLVKRSDDEELDCFVVVATEGRGAKSTGTFFHEDGLAAEVDNSENFFKSRCSMQRA